jgi:hypothetical protein
MTAYQHRLIGGNAVSLAQLEEALEPKTKIPT